MLQPINQVRATCLHRDRRRSEATLGGISNQLLQQRAEQPQPINGAPVRQDQTPSGGAYLTIPRRVGPHPKLHQNPLRV